jgi:purine-nucleoside/S-methyl-5'-thioadenosine phosphorylase / adenosine deaminase
VRYGMSKDWIPADWPAAEGVIAGTTLRDSRYQLPKESLRLNQVHGTRVVHWGSADFDDGSPDADAIISDQPDSICVVRTADCVPILLCARDGSEIAAIHAGWRGLAAHIIDATLNEMKTPADALLAWLGPAISQDAFEVGQEVREGFGIWGEADDYFRPNERGRLQADLFGLAWSMLSERGVVPHGEVRCTFADAERFYSYRRDGDTGRLLSFVYRN